MRLSEAISGFTMFTRADGFSDSTVQLYTHDLIVLTKFLEDPETSKITEKDLLHFFVYLREVYHKDMGHENKPLSGSTLQNYWKAMRTFFEWAKHEELVRVRPDLGIRMPDNNPKIVLPLSEEEVKALIQGAEYTKMVNTEKRVPFRMKRSTGLRDVALIVLLLDTGVRIGEASRLNVRDVDLEKAEIVIRPFGNSRRKTKSRHIPLGKACTRAMWKHIKELEDKDPDNPVFISKFGRRLDKNAALHLIVALGNKVGINNCHPHRLRHTFAIEHLRNGGDVFTLQKILGHSTLKMVQNYLELAQTDTVNAHRRASPADKWHV